MMGGGCVRTHGPPIRVYGPSRWRRVGALTARPARAYVALATVVAMAAGVILISRQLWLPGVALLILASAVVIVVAGVILVRPQVHVVDRRAWWDIEKSCQTIVTAWPHVAGMSGIKDVAPVIESARWEIARLAAERDKLVEARNQALFAQYGLDPDDSLRGDLAARHDLLTLRLASMDEETARRVGRLRSLAEHCAQFAYGQDAVIRAPKKVRRAHEALKRADSAILGAAPWEVRSDPAIDLSERTVAVLAAYRELAAETVEHS
jgi:hypothetical protein